MQSSDQTLNQMLLSQKFPSKSALYSYMTTRLNIFLPSCSSCRLEWLREVLIGNKSVLLNEQVPQFKSPTQPELAVNLVFDTLRHDEQLMHYFDTDRVDKSHKYPERDFFWAIMFTIRKELTGALLDEVMAKRMGAQQDPSQAINQLQFKEIWVEKLLEHPVLSTHGSSKHGNIFKQMQKPRKPIQRRPVVAPSALQTYAKQVMEIKTMAQSRQRGPNIIMNQDDAHEQASEEKRILG